MEFNLEWIGSILGMLGAGLLALNVRYSGLGFVFFLLSNFFLIAFALSMNLHGLLWMQAVFTVTSLVGCYRWLAPQAREYLCLRR